MKKIYKTISFIFLSLSFIFYSFAIQTQAMPNDNVKLGIDNIDSHMELFENKKVGLITNATGVNSNFINTIDILNEKVDLRAIFAPEHGLRGQSGAGLHVNNETDLKTGIIIYSLYGQTKKPTSEMLENIDILVYDIQDAGARFYTYISTMKLSMEATKENNKTFIVLDRPNPLSGEIVEGNILKEEFKSFVGISQIPQRYGLTIGELAKYFNEHDNVNCSLKIIEMTNWKRNMYYDQTGLNTWIMPSPNIPTLETAIVYSGTCLFEGTNISEGRGTTRPFEIIGAPWIDSLKLSETMNSTNLPGVYFRPVSFIPSTSKFANEPCNGVQIHVLKRSKFNAIKTSIALIYTIKNMYPNEFKYIKYQNSYSIDRLYGSDKLRKEQYKLNELYEHLDGDSDQFKTETLRYHIYK